MAEELAARLGVTVRDTDADIEATAGTSVQDLFIDHGEAHFRELEEDAVAKALDEHDGVVALGGGAVLSDRTRERLRDHRVLFLDVGLTQAVRRVGLGTGRPLLLGNVRAQLKQLMDARHALYREVADLTVLTDDLDPAQVADQALAFLEEKPMTTRLTVHTASPYEVVVGHGVTDEVRSLVGDEARRVAVIHPPTLRDRAEHLRTVLDDLEVLLLEVPDGEAAKSAEVLTRCWDALGDAGFTRSDVVIGLGGGATTDLAGFVAASWLRGVRFVNLPTTVLGMVDAAVGGKTGINTASGKNLVGAFHEPAGRAVRPRRPGVAARRGAAQRHGRGREVRVHRRPVDPRARRGGTGAHAGCGFAARCGAHREGHRGQGGHRRRRPARDWWQLRASAARRSTTATPSATRSSACTASGCAMARRSPSAWCSSPSWRTAPAASTPTCWPGTDRSSASSGCRPRTTPRSTSCSRPCEWTRRPGATQLRFVVLDGLAHPAVLAGPDEQLLREAHAALAP